MKNFHTPDELSKYSLAVAEELMVNGYEKQSKILEKATKSPGTTGWEWLDQIKNTIKKIKVLDNLPIEIEKKLNIVLEATNSDKPYA